MDSCVLMESWGNSHAGFFYTEKMCKCVLQLGLVTENLDHREIFVIIKLTGVKCRLALENMYHLARNIDMLLREIINFRMRTMSGVPMTRITGMHIRQKHKFNLNLWFAGRVRFIDSLITSREASSVSHDVCFNI